MTVQASRLSALLAAAAVEPLAAIGADPLIRGATVDSRRVEPGYLFFAIPGFSVHGERFVADAVSSGACAVIAESPRPSDLDSRIGWVQVAEPRRVAGLVSRECYSRPDEKLALVGVTGTNGKTTTTHLVESIGNAAGRRCGRIGTSSTFSAWMLIALATMCGGCTGRASQPRRDSELNRLRATALMAHFFCTAEFSNFS